MLGLRMSTVMSAAAASVFVSLLLLGMLVFANVQSKALVASYLTTIGSLTFIAHSILYNLLPTRSSFDTTATVTYFSSTQNFRAEYYAQKTGNRIFVESVITDHVDVEAGINRLGMDILARDFVVA